MKAKAPMFLKRVVDVFGSTAALLLSFPISLITAIAIKVGSRGPVLYKQERVGKDGETFLLYKFRSMVTEADSGSKLTTEGDSRVTAMGKVIRPTNIDEIPQLLNVLRGEMSLVGPRPEVPEYVDLDDGRWQEVLSVRPGITSPETITFRNEDEILARFDDPEEGYVDAVLPRKLSLARSYVRNQSFAYDLKVIGQTIIDVLTGGRAYSQDPQAGAWGDAGRDPTTEHPRDQTPPEETKNEGR
jgi:lipopolysaccharide/colanic/teichoic acid biosynthesis glycosyltransferase